MTNLKILLQKHYREPIIFPYSFQLFIIALIQITHYYIITKHFN